MVEMKSCPLDQEAWVCVIFCKITVFLDLLYSGYINSNCNYDRSHSFECLQEPTIVQNFRWIVSHSILTKTIL